MNVRYYKHKYPLGHPVREYFSRVGKIGGAMGDREAKSRGGKKGAAIRLRNIMLRASANPKATLKPTLKPMNQPDKVRDPDAWSPKVAV